jgi:tRNA(Arg) A34 adenosine deaminase TadA
MSHDNFMQAAVDEAKKGLAEGGIPIRSVLLLGEPRRDYNAADAHLPRC